MREHHQSPFVRPLDRRDFLRGSVLGAAVLGAGATIVGRPASASAQDAGATGSSGSTGAATNLLPGLVADTSAGAWAFVPIAAGGPVPTLTEDTVTDGFGGHSIAAGTNSGGRLSVLTRGFVPVVAGRSYTALASVRTPRSMSVSVQVTWYRRDGSYLSVSTGRAVTSRAGVPAALTFTIAAPSGAAGGAVQVNVESALRAGEQVNLGLLSLADRGGATAWSVGTGTDVQPSGAGYLRLQDADTGGRVASNGVWQFGRGMSLPKALGKCQGGQVLSLPPNCIVQLDDFDPAADYCSARFGQSINTGCRGIQGTDLTSVLQPRPNALVTLSSGDTNRCALIGMYGPDDAFRGVLKHFTLRGTTQRQGTEYHGIRITKCTQAVVYGLLLVGASPGSKNVPPYETFGIGVTNSPDTLVSHTEVDGRDTRGNRVCASPVGWNTTTNTPGFVILDSVYLHHSLTSSLSFYTIQNLTTNDVRSEYNGSGHGTLIANEINHENCNGRIRHNGVSVIANYPINGGQHVALQNNQADMKDVQITVRSFDRCEPAGNGAFGVMISPDYPGGQKVKTLPVITLFGSNSPLQPFPASNSDRCTPTTGYVHYGA